MKRVTDLEAVFTGREACDTSVLICMFACLQGGKEQNRERKKNTVSLRVQAHIPSPLPHPPPPMCSCETNKSRAENCMCQGITTPIYFNRQK